METGAGGVLMSPEPGKENKQNLKKGKRREALPVRQAP
jgi:hypothetical protein